MQCVRIVIATAIIFLASTSLASAQSGCPEMPATVIHKDATKGSVEANLLTKLISSFQVKGELDRSVDDVFNRDGAIERAKMIALTYQCQQIRLEYPNDPQKRRDEFRREFTFLFGLNIPAPAPPSASPPQPTSLRRDANPPTRPTRTLSHVEANTEIRVHNPESIRSEGPVPQGCGASNGQNLLLISAGLSLITKKVEGNLSGSLGCSFNVSTDLSSRKAGVAPNIIAMKGPVTFQAQRDIIRALIREGIYLEAICASKLATQPQLSTLLTHAAFSDADGADVTRLTPSEFTALGQSKTAKEFNALLSGQHRCTVP